MTLRPGALVEEVSRGRWMWAYEIPWLPDLLAGPALTLTDRPIDEAFGRQIAFLRAMAAGAPPGAALQLRFTADPGAERISCHLVGAGETRDDAALLSQVLTTSLPPELPLEAVPGDSLRTVLRAVDPNTLADSHVVEIRRGIDRLDPSLEIAEGGEPVIFPWTWSRQAMLASLGLLRQQPLRTALVVHLESETLAPDVAAFLQDEVRRLYADVRDGADQPMTLAVVRAYHRWLRLLPKGCLSLRLLVASAGPLVPGLPESLTTDLTRSFEHGGDPAAGAADIVAPTTPAELDACAQILDDLRAPRWRAPRDRELARLLHTFDPLEANVAFRFPSAPRGGLPGIASQRVGALPQGVDARLSGGRTVEIGTMPTGARYALSERDLNQHVLVAGLPGFGKSSTVQLLLGRCWRELGLPFLVIDPAKGDYGPLFAALAAEGVDVGVHRLTPAAPAFNPLAVPPGVDAWTYAGRLVAAFDATLGLSRVNPLALIYLQRAVRRVYDDARDSGRQPTMTDLYRTTGDVLRHSSFSPQARGDMEGVLLGRIEVLATASTGRALAGGPDDGVPWDLLLARPTLVELGAFAGPTERALLFAVLIAGLVSYREAHPFTQRLGHLTVLEEAHRVLRPGGGDDVGVEVFVDAIAELRGAGEGFCIVDQAPSQLHPAVLKLTGTKLAHRLTEQEERAAVAATMVLDTAQADDLARLAPQRLVAYAATATAATLVDVDGLEHVAGTPPVERRPALAEAPLDVRIPCFGCPVMCEGSAGARHMPELVERVRDRPLHAGELLEEAHALTGSLAQSYCLAAHAATALVGRRPSDHEVVLRQLRAIHDYQRRLRTATPIPT
jgi:hypothetical protein